MDHIDEGFDFLGFNIRKMRKRGTSKYYVYTVPSRKAIQAIKDKVTAKTYEVNPPEAWFLVVARVLDETPVESMEGL